MEKMKQLYGKKKRKDIALENEMLYRLMVYLGGDSAKSKRKN